MSVEAMALVLHHSSATGTAKLILLGIANHEGDGGAYPSVATLARYANSDRRTVQRATEKLIEAGELTRLVQQGGDRFTPVAERTNLYRIAIVCPADCDGSTRHRKRVPIAITPAASVPPGDTSAARGAAPAPPKPSTNHPITNVDPESHVGNRVSGHKHGFDEVSGYCRCGYRDDGRLIDPKSGLEFQKVSSER